MSGAPTVRTGTHRRSGGPATTPSRAGRPMVRVLRVLAPHRARLVAATLTAVLAELCAVALMGTAAWLIARAAGHPEIAVLALAVVAVRALATGRGVLRYVDRLIGHDAVLAATAELRSRVFGALLPLAPAGTPAFRRGDLLTRLVDDVDAVADLLLRCLLPATVFAAVGAGGVGFGLVVLPAAGLVSALGLLVAGIAVPALVYASTSRSGRLEDLRGTLSAASIDLTAGAADLLAFGAAGAHLAHARELTDAVAAAERRRGAGTTAAAAVALLVQGLTTAAVTWVGAVAVAQGRLSEVLLVVLAVSTMATFELVTPLPAAARRYAEVRSSIRRIAEVLDTPAPVTEPAAPVPAPGRARGRIDICGVRARHRGSARPALDGVDLHLEQGRRIAVVGASGSGKSTLLAVLMRFLDHEAGEVRLDGRDVRELAGDTVRRAVTGVTQDAHVFHTDLRANLLVAQPDATDDELRTVAARTRMLPWIESLPQGWSTVVGEGGASLSGGQRQRLLLARALLADPPVLVLDEPTEGLDPATADVVLTDLLDATRDRTTLLVTHRPAGLAAVDEVVVLDRGRVRMRGSHRELLADPSYPGASPTL